MAKCFKTKFYEDWVWKLNKKIESLCHLPDVKIAWINPYKLIELGLTLAETCIRMGKALWFQD